MPLRSTAFWVWFLVTAVVCSLFFAWELGAFLGIIWSLPRMTPTPLETVFTVLIIFLLALAAGLIGYRRKNGTCPIGARNASAISGALGAFTLLCPVCLLLPASIFGVGLSLSIIAPFLPLLRIVVILLLGVSIALLWPKK